MHDLKAAIRAAEEAFSPTSLDQPNGEIVLDNISSQLGRLYERTGNKPDLERAIENVREPIR
jgi:hypothetical protein